MIEWLLVPFGFLLGATPFAVLIGRYGLGVDIRAFGDGNPGAFNVLRAGGIAWGGLALVLDISKGAIPAGLAAHVFDIDGVLLVMIAVAPVLGHAFSPFLGFQGGKAIAATAGMLIGLSLLVLPIVFMIALVVFYLSLTSSAWAVMFTMIVLLIHMLLIGAPLTWFAAVGVVLLILIYRHHDELGKLPELKKRGHSVHSHRANDH